ncbi:hypothetical protein COP2_041928 [Malus domestica]
MCEDLQPGNSSGHPTRNAAQVTISSTIEVVPALPPLSSRVLGSKSFFASLLCCGTWIASLSSSTLCTPSSVSRTRPGFSPTNPACREHPI